MKRAAALLLAGALTLGLASCSGGKSADELVTAAGEKLKGAGSVNASYYTEMTYTMDEDSAKSTNTMELTLFTAPALRIKADITMEMEGVSSQKMTMYTVEEGGVATQYLTDGTDWFKAPAGEDTAGRYDVWGSMEKYLSLTDSMKNAGSETLDGRATTKLTGTISGKNLVQTLDEGGMLTGISTMSQDQQEKIKTDLEGIPALTVSLWVDKEGGYPAKFEADFTKTIADMQAQIGKTLGGFESASAPALSSAVVRILCQNVGAAVDFELPAEAKSAEEVTDES